MEDLHNGNFKVSYGRVGGSETVLTYPISQWDKKYNEKLKKGYIDVTEKITAIKKTGELDISDPDVKDLISFLMKEAKQSIKRDYQISANEVTQEQINEAESILNSIGEDFNNNRITNNFIDIDDVNNRLKTLYSIIPRRMSDTRSYFLNSPNFQYLYELLQSEQSRLDTLRSQVNINQVSSFNITLNDLGFTCELASEVDRDIIRNNTDFRLNNHRVFKISNKTTSANVEPDPQIMA